MAALFWHQVPARGKERAQEMKLLSELQVLMFSGHTSCGLWTNFYFYGVSSLALRRISNCFNDSRRPEASSLFVDARDGTSRRCQVVARPSNAESAQHRRLFTPGFAAAVSTSGTHIDAKCPHLSAYQYPRNACRISKSICQATEPFVDTIPWYNKKIYRVFHHRSITCQNTRGPTQCDIGRTFPNHLQYPTIWHGQRNDFSRQSCIK